MADETGINLDEQPVENKPIDPPVQPKPEPIIDTPKEETKNPPGRRVDANGVEYEENGFAVNLKSHLVTFTPREDLVEDEELIKKAVQKVLEEEKQKIQEESDKFIEEKKKENPKPLPDDTTGPDCPV